MEWQEKRPKNADANIKHVGDRWDIRVKLLLPDHSVFERKQWATSRTAARKMRDDMYALYNAQALEIIAQLGEPEVAERSRMTLEELGLKCRDEWWPARGRSADIADQYYQKVKAYCIPILGAERLIDTITPDDWDLILRHLLTVESQYKGPLSESTIRKIKACLSSALSCAVSQRYLASNPIRGIPYKPHPLDEADRLGKCVEELDDDEAPAKRMLSDEEARELLKASKDSIIRPMIVLQLAFGLRIAEALGGEFRRRVKVQGLEPTGDSVRMLFWALLASGKVVLRKVDGYESLHELPKEELRLAA